MTELHAAGAFFSAAAPAATFSLFFLLLLSFSAHFFFTLTHPELPQQKTEKSGRKVIKIMRKRENNIQGDGERCRDEGDENKTNGEECTKGNEAKRQGAAERSMITR